MQQYEIRVPPAANEINIKTEFNNLNITINGKSYSFTSQEVQSFLDFIQAGCVTNEK